MEEKFSIAESLRFGWETLKPNIVQFIVVLLVAGMINGAFGWLTEAFKREGGLVWLVATLAQWIVQVMLSIGFTLIVLSAIDRGMVRIGDLFTGTPFLFQAWFSMFVFTIIIGVGLLLLIVPGIILAIRLQFFMFFIVDRRAGSLQALQMSWDATSGQGWQLFLFSLAAIGLNLVGMLCFFVGLLITVPMTMVAQGYIYRRLTAPAPAWTEPPSRW